MKVEKHLIGRYAGSRTDIGKLRKEWDLTCREKVSSDMTHHFTDKVYKYDQFRIHRSSTNSMSVGIDSAFPLKLRNKDG